MAGAKRSRANMRLQAKGVDPLGYLIDEFKKDPSVEFAFRLLPYAHGTMRQVDNNGDTEQTTIKVVIGAN